MILKEIGKIHSPYLTKKDAPRQGRSSKKEMVLDIHEAYKEGMTGLEIGNHIVVIYWGDRSDRTTLISTPPRASVARGVFASRSPNRPNPLSLNVAKIIDIEGLKITLVGLDALDDSPVLDIKPFINMLDNPSD